MPSQIENHDALLITLYDTWQAMPFYKRWFFPRALGLQLTQYQNNASPENERAAYDAFLNTWSIQRWFFSSLTEFSEKPFPRLLDLVNAKPLSSGEQAKENIDAVFAIKNGSDPSGYSKQLNGLRYDQNIVKSLIRLRLPSINEHTLSSQNIYLAFFCLLREGILNNYDAIVAQSHCPLELAISIIDLNKAGLCQDQANLDLFFELTKSITPTDIGGSFERVANALIKLHEEKLLEGERAEANREIMLLTSYYAIENFTNDLIELNKAGLLNDTTHALIIEQSNKRGYDLSHLSKSITALQKAGVFTQENSIHYVEAVVNRNVNYQSLPEVFELLEKHQLFTEENRQKIIEFIERANPDNQDNLEIFSNLLKQLSQLNLLAGDLAQDNFDKVMNHPNKTELESLIVTAGPHHFKVILPDETAQATFNQAIECPYPEGGAIAISWIMSAHLPRNEGRAATYYQELIVTHANILLADPSVWEMLPEQLLTRERYEAIIAIAEEHAGNPEAGRRAFRDYVNQVIRADRVAGRGRDYEPEVQNQINGGQSTHTTSVHKTVSEAAQKLATRYATEITPDMLQENKKLLSKWIQTLSNEDFKESAAKRCFERLTQTDGYPEYKDRVSNVSINQLFVLIWVAIHDDVREGSLDDAKRCLVEGLHEAQRGSNLSINGVDNGEDREDGSICVAGAFNKVMEKLWGIHPDVNIEYMTLETFKHKIIPVLNEETDAWSAALTDELKNQLISAENSSDFIWTNIKPRVEDLLFSEFGSLFPGDKNNAEFQRILDQWRQAFDFEERMPEILKPVSISAVPGTLFGPASPEEQGQEESKDHYERPKN